jgi:hypothetical protein
MVNAVMWFDTILGSGRIAEIPGPSCVRLGSLFPLGLEPPRRARLLGARR